MICDVCGREHKSVTIQPSRRQLLFGGFNVSYEKRCGTCESEVAKWAMSLINDIRKCSPT